MLAPWGRLVYRRRAIALASSLAILAVSLLGLSQGGTLLTYQPPTGAESTLALQEIQHELPSFSESSFFLVLSHPTLNATDDAYQRAAEDAIAPLRTDARVASVTTPYPGPVPELVSRDGHRVLVLVALRAESDDARLQYDDIRRQVRSDTLDIVAGGDLAINADFEATLDADLQRAEVLSIPLTLLLLVVVFGTLVAALLPLGVGLLAVAGGVGAVLFAARFTDVSVYALNIVTLIGLGVAIDYSLFIVNRYREELAHGKSGEDAMARTMETAGRAVLFSGLTVAVGLAGLTFYSGMYFASMGMAGALVVAFAVTYSLLFLPALLALLGGRIHKGRVPFLKGGAASPRESGAWHSIATTVMKRPVMFLVGTTALVLVAAAPFLDLQMASATEKALPADTESRIGTGFLRTDFPGGDLTTMHVVVSYPGDPLTAQTVGGLYDLSRAIQQVPGVDSVQSVVDLDPALDKASYETMYANGSASAPPNAQAVATRFVGPHIVVLEARTAASQDSETARQIVRALRALPSPEGGEKRVTGLTAFDVDTLRLLEERTPYALGFIGVATYVLLLIQTRSVLLPLKALVMNVLSIAAAFGALVFVFQQGHFSSILNFTPAPIDPSVPVLLFCIVFGLSMDYEVLLLSRMHEEFERTRDNTQSVALGLEKSGRLITSAAAIMVLVFGAFATANVTIIKAIGLGLALAILIDATLVRALIVPSAMKLMGRWNWWNPWTKTR